MFKEMKKSTRQEDTVAGGFFLIVGETDRQTGFNYGAERHDQSVGNLTSSVSRSVRSVARTRSSFIVSRSSLELCAIDFALSNAHSSIDSPCFTFCCVVFVTHHTQSASM